MSNYLTERKNYQYMIEKNRKINEIKNNELNKECFDCGSCYPEYISINNGVFICNNCIKVHNKFPKEISLTLKNDLSTLNNKELQYMYYGGNKKLLEFIHYEYPELSKLKKNILYQTRAMQYYRDNLNYLVNSGSEPIRPSKEINAYEIIDINNEKNNKKYERINLEGNIYKTKKRNKSLGNKNKIKDKELIYDNSNKIRKSSRNNKSFRKNHFLDEDNIEEELKRHKSFYKEMNKLFKDEEEETKKKEYNYYRKKSNMFLSNNINNNIKENNLNNKFVKYNSKTNYNNKNKEHPIENIYNNNYYNLSTTKNIFMFTPLKDDILYNNNTINNNNNQIEKISLTNVNDIYSKPKVSNLINSCQNYQNKELYLPLKRNIKGLNLTNINEYKNDYYLSTDTYNSRKYNQKKTKELFANININKKNEKNNLIRYIKRNEFKKMKEKEEKEIINRNNYTFRDNNKIQIKEIKIEKIGGKRSSNLVNDKTYDITNIINDKNNYNNQNYKKLDISNINYNRNKFSKRYNNKIEEKERFINHTQIEDNKEKKIKNINIFFDKNKDINTNKIFEKNKNSKFYTPSDKLEGNIGNSTMQKLSIRNKYKMKRKQDNV